MFIKVIKTYVTRTRMKFPVRHNILKSPIRVHLNFANFLVQVSEIGTLGQSEESV